MSKALKSLVEDLEKSFGKGTLSRIGDKTKIDIEKVPSGSLGLDVALGGGYARGRIIEIYGWESTGKTTLTLHAIAECQINGGKVAFIDAEHALDLEYASKLGVQAEELWISQPDNGEQALEIADKVVESGEFAMVVIDSVAALVPKAEIEGEMGESKMGLHARLMSQACRKLVSKVKKTNTSLVFINQLREKIGVMFGNPETTTGGNALKFYASQRIEVRRGKQLKTTDGTVYGHEMKLKVVKNKIAPPFKTALPSLIYGIGVSRLDEIIDFGVELGIIKKAGSWYSYADIKLGQGKSATRDLLLDNPELTEEIENKVKAKLDE